MTHAHTPSRDQRSSRRVRSFKCALVFSCAALFVAVTSPRAFVGYSQTPGSPPPEYKVRPGERFDEIVRGDFFAGMMGDEARLDRGMKYCEEVLSKNPKHAEALVWHGGGLLTRAQHAYTKGDSALGDRLWGQGLKEMDESVAYEPNNMGVMIGRAATLVGLAQSGWDSSDPRSRQLLASAVTDYEKVYQLQRPTFSALSNHSRGELLFGLASGWSRLGDQKKSREYLRLVLRECRGTSYETEAQVWLKKEPTAVVQHDCTGCHVSKGY
jgi:hypothetical protein